MTLDEYAILAQKTKSPYAKPGTINHWIEVALGLAGEAGELNDCLKKVLFHGHAMETARFLEELGDILWYVADGAAAAGTTLGAIATANLAKLERRYPQGFNVEASRQRGTEEG